MKKGVNAVITDNQGRVLIMKRNMDEEFSPGLWDLPGGEVKDNEKLEEAVKRETEEESGFRVEPEGSYFYVYHHAAYRSPKEGIDIYAFRVKVIAGETKLNDEHTEFKWVSKEEWKLFKYTPSVAATLKELFK